MKAAVFGLAQQLEIKEVDEPKMDEGHVLIQVKKAAICGSDKHSWEDGSGYGSILGHEYSGVVLDPGPRSDLKVGDRVTSVTQNPCGKCEYCKEGNDSSCAANGCFPGGSGMPGVFAERFAARADLVMKLADNVSDTNGALAEPVAVCWHALRKSGLKPGGKLLIHGVGALTAFIAQLAKAMGASMVVAIGSSQKRAQALLDSGDLDLFVKSGESGFYSRMMEVTGGGFDALIDTKCDAKGLNECMAVLKKGRIGVCLGIDSHDTSRFNVFDLTMSDSYLAGSYAYNIAEFKEVLDMMAECKINPEKYTGRSFPLDHAQDAFVYGDARSTLDLKIFLEP
jgi:threonine dehydrogenase-like Zn-dependent dehydrogenase